MVRLYCFFMMGQSNLQFRDVRFLFSVYGYIGERKWAIIKVFVIKKFLVTFLRGLPEPPMNAENLRFVQIVGAEQVVIRSMCYPHRTKLVGREFFVASSSFVIAPWT